MNIYFEEHLQTVAFEPFFYNGLLYWKSGLLYGTQCCIEDMHKYKYFQNEFPNR